MRQKIKVKRFIAKSKQIIVFMLMFIISSGVFAAQGNFAQRPRYVPDEILVKYKDGVTAKQKSLIRRGKAREQKSSMFKAQFLKTVGGEETRVEKWKLDANQSVEQVQKDLQSQPEIEYAEPNYYMYPMERIPNDNYYSSGRQWGLHNVGQQINGTWGIAESDMAMQEAWGITTGIGSGPNMVIVAVVDDGVQLDHDDFKDELAGVNNIGSGYDFIGDDEFATPLSQGDSHGTNAAGVIGAVGNNGIGISGVSWNVNIMPIRFAINGIGDTDKAADAFYWAEKNGADIINYSWGMMHSEGEDLKTLSDAVDWLEANNVLLVAPAGNDDVNNEFVPLYPASFDNKNIISVAASNQTDSLAYWSQYGFSSVDVMAPGENICTTTTDNGYTCSDDNGDEVYDPDELIHGTSFSAPYVAGVAALIKSHYTEADFEDIKGRIMAGVDVRETSKDKVASGGRVNAFKALDIEETPVLVIKSVDVADSANGVLDPNEQTDLVVEIENVWVDAADVSATLINMDEDFITVIDPDASIEVIRKGESEQAIFNIRYTNAAEYRKIPFGLEITANDGEYSVTRYFNLVTGYLENNVETQGAIQTDDYDDVHYYHFTVPANAKRLDISTTSEDDIDIFLTRNGRPKVAIWGGSYVYGDEDYEESKGEYGNESITINNPQAGEYFIAVHNYTYGLYPPYTPVEYTISRNLELYPDDDTGDDTDSGGGGGGNAPLVLLILLGGFVLFFRGRFLPPNLQSKLFKIKNGC